MNHTLLKTTCALSALIVMAGTLTQAADSYSPYAGQNYPSNVYFGDTHLHTNYSVDAYGMGNKSLTPDDAYRFAQGKVVTAHNGQKVRLSRPLDFLVVADHGVNMGVLPRLALNDPLLLKTKVGKIWAKKLKKYSYDTEVYVNGKSSQEYKRLLDSIFNYDNLDGYSFFWKAWKEDYVADKQFRRSVWEEVGANAERHNNPGEFTAFIGYEWTPSTVSEKSPNLHRNIIFENGSDQTNQVIPFTIQDSDNVEDLWGYLNDYENKTGGRVLAIAHNGNYSSGVMFSLQDYDGNPLSVHYAQTRSRWEPLYEVTQMKGDGETHPLISPNDEFADFETINSPVIDTFKHVDPVTRKKSEYARSALKLGLEQQVKLGINPFKFGLIGSTDSHTSLATGKTSNFWGKTGLAAPGKHRIKKDWNYASGGYAGVWAQENTRESLFAAMKRRETYATTGPRMTVRFFGGWDYNKADAVRPDLARIGYDGGVPMGGDLTQAPKGQAPKFLIRAVKDPDGANLDRVQVIKGWHDKAGELHEKIYNVALSDGRKDRGQKTRKVGSTVDVKDASYTNTIGDPELATVWTDPDFDKDELAFYYVRVLEIPTPRWTAYDAKFFKIKDIPEDVPMVTQERAYTSPIWYTP